MTDVECMEMAGAIGEAARDELPEGMFVFVTVFDGDDAAAAYGTGDFERTKEVLEDMLTSKPIK